MRGYFFLVTLAATAALFVSPQGVAASTASLRARLQAAGIDALYPGDSAYVTAAIPFNKRFTLAPAAIAYPTSTQHVSDAVKAGVAEGLRVTPKSGGHSYTAFGLGGENGHLVIDLSRMKQITVDAKTQVATIQTGNRLGDTALSIYSQGQRALPHGTCSYVGIGGHAAHGGYGFTSRAWGLTLDTIVAHDVVLGNGTIVTASAQSNPDLFWALRGAGSSFGIVTQYHMQTLPAPSSTTEFSYSWSLSASAAAKAFSAYQDYCLSSGVPANIGFELNLGKGAQKGQISISFGGSHYGDTKAFAAIVAPFLKTMPTPKSQSVKPLGWIDNLQALAGKQPLSSQGQNLAAEHDTFYAKSLTTPQNLKMSQAAITAFANYLSNQGWQTNTNWFVQLELYGGVNSKINSVAADATAYAHRDTLWTIQFYASSSNYAPPFPDSGFTFLDEMVASITSNNPSSWEYGAYTNYIDDRLTTAQWESLYFGNHFARLQSIKAQYDPHGTFTFPQSINAAAAKPAKRLRTI